jgi:hypothetical protein
MANVIHYAKRRDKFMLESFEEITDKKIEYKEKDVSVMIQYGDEYAYINGTYLGETDEHFIVKNSKNKIYYIYKNKIIYHVFKEH